MKNKFWTIFDKDKFLIVSRFIVLFIVVVIVFNLIHVAYSKYESGANSSAAANVAFFIITEGSYDNSIALTGLVPSDTPYEYTFNVSNYSITDRCNVNLTYTINFKATTNLPLSFAIYRATDRTTNIITSESEIQDQTGAYYRLFNDSSTYNFGFTTNQTDTYTLVVNFPSSYKNNPDAYQSLIYLFTISIVAQQVV